MTILERIAPVVELLRSFSRTKQIALSIGSVLFLRWLVAAVKKRKLKSKLTERRLLAQRRKEVTRKQCSEASDIESVVQQSAVCLVAAIQEGKMTATQALHAFQKKALETNKTLNFITETLPEAEEQAKLLDAGKKYNGLLSGVPVSIKENICFKGYDATMGLQFFINKLAEDDAVAVKVLKHHGAIPFVRTNLPQAMLSYCCSNPIYANTLNPKDFSRSPGGSSGGEGAILGCGASVIGLGTDIGGSVRVPAEYCGVYALKPTVGRVSKKGQSSTTIGNTAIQGVIGPMARDFSSLVLVTQALLSPEMFELDNVLPCLPFNEQEYQNTGPLRIGFYTDDGNTTCQPSNVRAVMEAKAVLEKLGHEVVPFDYPSLLGKCTDLFGGTLLADRGERLSKLLAEDIVEPALKPSTLTGIVPAWIFRLLYAILGDKDKHIGKLLKMCCGHRSIGEFLNHVSQLEDWRVSFMKQWKHLNLDAIISPVTSSPAGKNDIMPNVTITMSYCLMYNALNFPAGVMPVTKVTQDDLNQTFHPKSMLEKLLWKSSQTAEGLSVGVQIAALPFKEEMCLRVMRDLEKGLGRQDDKAMKETL